MTDRLPPAGWYRDPGGQFDHRYWDGERWTDGVARDGQVLESPLPPERAAEAREAVTDRRAAWPVHVAGVGLAAAMASVVLAGVLLGLAEAAGWDGPVAQLVFGQIGLYGGLLASCWWVSRRWGSGRFTVDYGLRYGRRDWLRGLGYSLLARLAAIVAAAVFILWSEDFLGSNTEAFSQHEDDPLTMALLVASALVAAPVVEELFFRGLLQRALESALPAALAVVAQALLFGLAHTSVDLGPGNVSVVAATAAAGIVFGLAARRWYRLGPSIAAHAWFNLVPVVFILLLD